MSKITKLKEITQKRMDKKEEIIVPKVNNNFKSILDYSKYNIDDEETIIYLKEREAILSYSSKEISKKLADQSKAFYEAQQMLSKKQGGDGTFTEWILDLGFSRSYVYNAINSYNMFLSYSTEKIFELPSRIRDELYKKKNEFEDAEVIEIISNDKPKEKLKELEKIKIEQKEINKYKNIDNDFEKYNLEFKEQKNLIYEKRIELEKIKKQYDEMKNELKELKDKEKELIIKIKILKQRNQ